MKNNMNFSFSRVSTYQDCERKFWLNYIEKIRPTTLGSALLLGTAIDDSVSHILLKQEGDYINTFHKCMNNFEVNKNKKVMPKDALSLKFFASDIDMNLVEESFMIELCKEMQLEEMEIGDFLEYCKDKRKRKEELEEAEQYIFNRLAHESLSVKGVLILEKLNEWIEENVAEVHSVQKKIEIENEQGDVFVGFSDFIVTLKDGRKVLIDLKTSSDPNKYYPDDSASNSPQLGIYAQEEGIEDVAYLVGDKKIRVREPRVRIRYVEGKVTGEHLDQVFYDIDVVVTEIKEKLEFGIGMFEMNTESCNSYGGCAYAAFCHKGKMSGLEKIK